MTAPRRLAAALLALFFLVLLGHAQDPKRATHLRTVRGVVTDKEDNPLPGAVVFLKNTRTQAVQSRIADDAGAFRFSGLDPNADYEIHAEKDGAKSPTRTVSSFDNRKEIVINLRIDRKRG
ncbi:MAG: carboxypeptidase-like regulatory domain-containing protein [Acidobacteriia bacterium]|nr:carboxypeptidase-like regulatory domain-containing protein [Terriglobia bacterium]